MLRTILVPLDGSSFSEQALPTALRIAERHDARLELVLVHEAVLPSRTQGAPPVDTTLNDGLRRMRASYLEDIADWLRQSTFVTTSATIEDGPVVPTLAATIQARDVDLVVMTTHGRGGLSRAWRGSVADAMVRRVTAPVLLVKPDAGGSRRWSAPPIERVLIPLDGSPFSEDAIDHVLAVLGVMTTRYTLLRVLTPIALPALADAAPMIPIDVGVERPEAEAYLEELADRLRLLGMRIDTRVLVEQQPARAILDYSRTNGIDLIAMATHGRSGLGRLVLGSVADQVLRSATVPVLLHRPPAERRAPESAVDHSVRAAALDSPPSVASHVAE